MMRKPKKLAGILAMVLSFVLTACGTNHSEGDVLLWYTSDLKNWDNATTALGAAPYTGNLTVPELMTALLGGPPEGSHLLSPFPADTRLQRWEQEGNRVTVDLSWQYGDLVGVELTLADYCITLTLTQLEGVEEVCITANGSQLEVRDHQAFTKEDVMFTGAEEEPVDVTAALHFLRRGSQELGFEFRMFRLVESDSAPRVVLEALIDGPEDSGLEGILPPDLKVNSVRQEGKVCYVDLSHALVQQMPREEWQQRVVIDSLVNTLCSLETVEQVHLLVDGQPLEQYGSVQVKRIILPID